MICYRRFVIKHSTGVHVCCTVVQPFKALDLAEIPAVAKDGVPAAAAQMSQGDSRTVWHLPTAGQVSALQLKMPSEHTSYNHTAILVWLPVTVWVGFDSRLARIGLSDTGKHPVRADSACFVCPLQLACPLVARVTCIYS